MRFMLYFVYFGGAVAWLYVTYCNLLDERTCEDGGDDEGEGAGAEARARRLQQKALRVVGFPLWFCWVAYWVAGELRRLLREISGRSR